MPELRTIEIGQSVEVTLDGDGARQALELVGQIEPGESGAPVLDTDGRIIGIVFAASKTDRTGWAIASEEFVAVLSQPLSALALDCP